MKIAAIVEALVKAGASPEMILAAVRAAENQSDSAIEKRRAADRDRQSRRRERNVTSRDVTVTERDTPVPDKERSPTPPKEINPSPVVVSPSAREFGDFWSAYPHKVGKRDAEAAFGKALKRADFETIMAGLSRYVAKTDDRPWCNPSTWLNQDRWADSPADVPQRARGSPPPRHETDLQRISRELRERQDDQRRADFEFDGPVIQGFPG